MLFLTDRVWGTRGSVTLNNAEQINLFQEGAVR
jgi:hypothetical protein